MQNFLVLNMQNFDNPNKPRKKMNFTTNKS